MNNKSTAIIKRITSFALMFSLCLGILICDVTRANAHDISKGTYTGQDQKISSDLQEQISKVSPDTRLRVIIQISSIKRSLLNTFLLRSDVSVQSDLQKLDSIVVELPARIIADIIAYGGAKYISLDRETKSFGHISATTGTDAVRQSTTTSLLGGTTTTTLDGTGIGIAVIDSGIDATHKGFLDKSNNLRVVASKDFTGENRTDDPYGHGTHVASIAAGNGRISNATYIGIAPNANIVNLRVLNSTGTGSVSGLLNALNWVLSYRTQYNIRVVNMSLGSPAVDSYKNDPVCQAVRKLVDAGIVVVAAAGNNGKNSAGQKIYGQIHSPGNEPSAITVGAANTFGTDTRADDAVTTYSSRGPTRSFYTDSYGVKHYDNLIKPDLVAPGNKLIYAEAIGNLLVTQNPQLDAGVSPVDNRKMMYMNGTSMAAPIAAGAAALLLQANPKLTPNMVKALLMYTSQPLAGFNMLEQGAGQLNIEGAVRLAKLMRTDLTAATLVGAPLLTTLTLPSPQTTIAGQTFTWSQGLIMNRNYVTGTSLMTKYQRMYGLGVLIGDGVMIGDGVLIGNTTMLSSGVLIGDQIMTSSGITLSEGTPFLSCGVLIGDGILIGDGVLIGDGILIGDGVMVGDSVLMSDAMLQAQSAQANGDDTSSMQLQIDTGVDYLGY